MIIWVRSCSSPITRNESGPCTVTGRSSSIARLSVAASRSTDADWTTLHGLLPVEPGQHHVLGHLDPNHG